MPKNGFSQVLADFNFVLVDPITNVRSGNANVKESGRAVRDRQLARD
jgi:hypothetical protein